MISQISKSFGAAVSRKIIQSWIENVSDFYGKGFLRTDQIEEVSVLICNKYSDLKLTEMALFFNGLKMAEYGVFYGKIDPIVITKALIVFRQKRTEAIEKYQREEHNNQQREKQADWSQTAISLNEYLRKTNQKLEDLLPKLPSVK